ncbi:HNH endonuclease [Antrihabitans cavernicola]|uniref:HNH endonuclease n=1 Tax=Antrihabitans cavernicola TaxID=2495913 RepID=A0A5A7SG38_9NOCA|nr:HNH endonuclease signature motif containing protein [Spelaeibacter cavernicola]KAA0024409.1 HNH endonuclease [Spelaeibacter cavernicola]
MFDTGVVEEADAAGVAALVGWLAGVGGDVDDGARIDLLRALEDVKAACVAAQAKTAADFEASRIALRAAAGVPKYRRNRGISSEIALARRDSPHRGSQHLGFAQAMVDMPHTLALLERGLLNEWRATILVRETACLDREDRTGIDAELCADPTTLDGLGDRALTATVREHAARRDAEAMVKRASKAVGDRRVTTRPAHDTMAYVNALLPVDQAVAIQAILGRDADSLRAGGDERTRSQIMADLLVERVTGISAVVGPPITVNLVISDESLFADGTDAAHVEGYGPIPAGLARHWVKDRNNLELRRVYANPTTGALTTMESVSRCFPPGLARFIDVRDRYCRAPWCDAPIRHRDHIVEHQAGGPTTADNGAGLCEACNHAKQGAGWQSQPVTQKPGERHSYRFTIPTGHEYTSTAPPTPTPLDIYMPAERWVRTVLYEAA